MQVTTLENLMDNETAPRLLSQESLLSALVFQLPSFVKMALLCLPFLLWLSLMEDQAEQGWDGFTQAEEAALKSRKCWLCTKSACPNIIHHCEPYFTGLNGFFLQRRTCTNIYPASCKIIWKSDNDVENRKSEFPESIWLRWLCFPV